MRTISFVVIIALLFVASLQQQQQQQQLPGISTSLNGTQTQNGINSTWGSGNQTWKSLNGSANNTMNAT